MNWIGLLAQAPTPIQSPAKIVEQAASQPHTTVAIGAAAIVLVLGLVAYLTRTGAIARATMKESVRQPVFILVCVIGILVTLANTVVPFFTLGDDTKMFVDCGLATVLICSLLLAIWTSSMSVADEIEGKTAMTLLSKPITRRQFVLGKYLGILQSSLMMIAVLGVFLFVATYCKYGYDQKEGGQEAIPLYIPKTFAGIPNVPYFVKERIDVAMTIIPGLALIAMEVAVMASVSVLISTRFPMLFNIIACFAVFVIGHLTPILAQSNVKNVFVKFFAGVLATILPGLEHFNMSAAVSTGKIIAPDYIIWAGIYCACYTTMMIMLAFLFFEDRDLA